MENTTTSSGKVNPRELTPETYRIYCRLYLVEQIYSVVPVTSPIEYGHVAKLVNCIDPRLFDLQTETNKILLLNEIYALFMEAANVEFSREFLYGLMVHLAKYDPVLYK